MAPNFTDGDYALAVCWPPMRLRVDQVVLVRHPVYDLIIKRIANISESGHVLLKGDNVQSTSSERLGWVSNSNIIGNVCLRLPTPVRKNDQRRHKFCNDVRRSCLQV